MSYGETITRTDLMNILNQILPQSSCIQSWEYVGDYGSNVFNNSWTATDDGVAIVRASWNTSGNFAYWYVSDQTDGRQVANLGGTANGTTLTTMIPIIKGHTYQSPAKNAVSGAYFYFYKFTLKETIPEPAVDYIVEQGTNANGTYRKWNSGFAECWGSASISSGGYTGKWTFPCAFVDKSKITIHMTPVDSTSTAWNVNYGATTITQADIGRTPSSVTNVYYMSAVGTWK